MTVKKIDKLNDSVATTYKLHTCLIPAQNSSQTFLNYMQFPEFLILERFRTMFMVYGVRQIQVEQ